MVRIWNRVCLLFSCCLSHLNMYFNDNFKINKTEYVPILVQFPSPNQVPIRVVSSTKINPKFYFFNKSLNAFLFTRLLSLNIPHTTRRFL